MTQDKRSVRLRTLDSAVVDHAQSHLCERQSRRNISKSQRKVVSVDGPTGPRWIKRGYDGETDNELRLFVQFALRRSTGFVALRIPEWRLPYLRGAQAVLPPSGNQVARMKGSVGYGHDSGVDTD